MVRDGFGETSSVVDHAGTREERYMWSLHSRSLQMTWTRKLMCMK